MENKLVIPDEMMQYLNQSILGVDSVTSADITSRNISSNRTESQSSNSKANSSDTPAVDKNKRNDNANSEITNRASSVDNKKCAAVKGDQKEETNSDNKQHVESENVFKEPKSISDENSIQKSVPNVHASTNIPNQETAMSLDASGVNPIATLLENAENNSVINSKSPANIVNNSIRQTNLQTGGTVQQNVPSPGNAQNILNSVNIQRNSVANHLSPNNMYDNSMCIPRVTNPNNSNRPLNNNNFNENQHMMSIRQNMMMAQQNSLMGHYQNMNMAGHTYNNQPFMNHNQAMLMNQPKNMNAEAYQNFIANNQHNFMPQNNPSQLSVANIQQNQNNQNFRMNPNMIQSPLVQNIQVMSPRALMQSPVNINTQNNPLMNMQNIGNMQQNNLNLINNQSQINVNSQNPMNIMSPQLPVNVMIPQDQNIRSPQNIINVMSPNSVDMENSCHNRQIQTACHQIPENKMTNQISNNMPPPLAPIHSNNKLQNNYNNQNVPYPSAMNSQQIARMMQYQMQCSSNQVPLPASAGSSMSIDQSLGSNANFKMNLADSTNQFMNANRMQFQQPNFVTHPYNPNMNSINRVPNLPNNHPNMKNQNGNENMKNHKQFVGNASNNASIQDFKNFNGSCNPGQMWDYQRDSNLIHQNYQYNQNYQYGSNYQVLCNGNVTSDNTGGGRTIACNHMGSECENRPCDNVRDVSSNNRNGDEVQVWDISQSQGSPRNAVRQEAYRRTLAYVQSCQGWTNPETVSSSTHPLCNNNPNMVVNDLNTSLSSFYEENQFLQMKNSVTK